MAEQVDVNDVIEQLVARIAQLEFEVAVLKSLKGGSEVVQDQGVKEEEDKESGGYM